MVQQPYRRPPSESKPPAVWEQLPNNRGIGQGVGCEPIPVPHRLPEPGSVDPGLFTVPDPNKRPVLMGYPTCCGSCSHPLLRAFFSSIRLQSLAAHEADHRQGPTLDGPPGRPECRWLPDVAPHPLQCPPPGRGRAPGTDRDRSGRHDLRRGGRERRNARRGHPSGQETLRDRARTVDGRGRDRGRREVGGDAPVRGLVLPDQRVVGRRLPAPAHLQAEPGGGPDAGKAQGHAPEDVVRRFDRRDPLRPQRDLFQPEGTQGDPRGHRRSAAGADGRGGRPADGERGGVHCSHQGDQRVEPASRDGWLGGEVQRKPGLLHPPAGERGGLRGLRGVEAGGWQLSELPAGHPRRVSGADCPSPGGTAACVAARGADDQ